MIPKLPPVVSILRDEQGEIVNRDEVNASASAYLDSIPAFVAEVNHTLGSVSAAPMESVAGAIKGVIGPLIRTHIFTRGPGGKTRRYSAKTWHIRQKAVRREKRGLPVLAVELVGIL